MDEHPLRCRFRLPVLALALVAVAVMPGCSVRKLAIDQLGAALAEGSSTWASDDDLELVARRARRSRSRPSRACSPRRRTTATCCCGGERLHPVRLRLRPQRGRLRRGVRPGGGDGAARAGEAALPAGARLRAARPRGRPHPGFGAALRRDPAAALAGIGRKDDVPLLYWTGAAWGALHLAVQGRRRGERRPAAGRGDDAARARARRRLRRRRDLRTSSSPSRAASRPPPAARRSGRAQRSTGRWRSRARPPRRALRQPGRDACASARRTARSSSGCSDARAGASTPTRWPEQRLANLVAQKRARWLLSRADELFIE